MINVLIGKSLTMIGGKMSKKLKSICKNCKFIRKVMKDEKTIYKCRVKLMKRMDSIVQLKNECDINHFEVISHEIRTYG
jgi:hypothetical protein